MKMSDHLNRHSTLSDEDRQLAEDLAAIIERADGEVTVTGATGDEVELPAGLASMLSRAAEMMADGYDVAVVPHQTEVTPRQAAELLNISRPYLVSLLDRGEIPFHRVGTHRRMRLPDVLDYKRQRDSARDAELQRLSELSREMGIPE